MTKLLKCAVALSVLILSIGLSGCIRPDKHTIVPDVLGLHIEEAQELVNKRSLLDIFVKGIPAEESELEYIVYYQDPQAGTKVRKGTSVLMTHYNRKLNPYAWVRGLLTLNPLPPSAKLIEDLGFNLLVPYAATTSSWKGDIITRSMRPGKVVARFTNDEPDCRKHNPYQELELYKQMKKETPNIPIGTILCGDIGCGHEGTCPSKAEYKRQWLEVINQMDFVMVDNYPYRPDWPDPVKRLEEFHQFYLENVRVPIIMIVQAHWGYHGTPTLTKPNPMEQVKFWVERGYGYVAYPWKDELNGVGDMQEEWKQANEWAASQI